MLRAVKPWQPGDAFPSLEPIGIVHSGYEEKVEAPRQPQAARGQRGRIELFPGRNFEHALEDLEGWEYLWVIYAFHLNSGWRPKVLPPRSESGRKGVFSTRSPHRPNPIGLSAVRLERIEGLTLHLVDVDMVDGTPVLDIKPYVPYTDAHPQARSGWLEDAGNSGRGETPADPVAPWDVQIEPLAQEQIIWIESHTKLKLGERIHATLALGPKPNPYRRIKPDGDGLVLAIKDWRVRFGVSGRSLLVRSLASGYSSAKLAAGETGAGSTIALHQEFVARYG